MTVLVVEQGAGVAVRPPTLVTNMGLYDLTVGPTAAGSCQTVRVQSLLLHQGEVQA